MINWKKGLGSLGLIAVLLLSLLTPVSAAVDVPVQYLALGDSLAAGVTYDKKIADGYADLTAEYLEEQNALGTYSKAFAIPGYKTYNVLADLNTKPNLQEAIKNSNFITISAGANDLLSEAEIDREKGTILLDPSKIPGSLKSISENYNLILQKIKQLNPDASVYVMGYYFPFPFISEEQKPELIQLTHTLNKTIEAAALVNGASFVPVYEKFGDNPRQYVPNPEDIHPNLEGYKLLSEALLDAMMLSQKTAADLPEGHWAAKELNMLLAGKLLQLDEKGNIYPEKAITRAEAALILYNSIPMTTSIPENPGYKDVPESHPAYMAIAKLTEAGVFTKSENFNPDSPLTRVQMAKVLASAFGLKGDGVYPSYRDINSSYWGTPYIDAVTDNKLMIGFSNGNFGLHNSANRAQFAVVMVRAQALIK
ncbi:GDSL-type esterase/lipase family protein [Cytobacillus sp.]|uniref:GDSL-type esterase/lipase family protein n=1 Tax=Cytobacillus sp. TaxID=2675269 RepID=UPI003510EA35